MVFFLQSDVARLVLGYLKENKYPETYSCFLKECCHLSECYELLKTGAEIDTTVFGFSLLLILEEWGRCRQQGLSHSISKLQKTHPYHRANPISHSRRPEQKKNVSRFERKSPSSHCKTVPNFTGVSTSHLFEDTGDSALDSDDVDGASNIHSLDIDLHHGEISSEEEWASSRHGGSVHSRLNLSKSPGGSKHNKQTLVGIKKQRSPVRRTHSASPRKHLNVQFSDGLSGLTLLQSDIPVKSQSRSGEKKYPNLLNLLQVSSSTAGNKTNTADSTSVIQTVLPHIDLTSPDCEDQSDSIDQTVGTGNDGTRDVIGPICAGGTTIITSTRNKSPNKRNSLTKRLENTDTVIPLHKTPNKASRSPQKVPNSLITPSKLFQDGELNNSTRSPRRKKPKTPRKRNSDVSPTSTQRDAASGSEDRLPLFQQVLSDKRLHEKLAETCNIVSGQLKLSLSGCSESGDKPKAVSPVHIEVCEPKQTPVAVSKSLEEVLDIDTNYATEFLSEKIDMSDPAFECLFKLFGTDKESFSENLRKENQQAEKETEKLTKDLEDLERSLHEEFGTTRDTNHLTMFHKDKSMSGSQELYPTPGTGNQAFSQPASPFVGQAVCHSPFVHDRQTECVTGDRINNFTPLVRGNDVTGSIYSSPSHKSTYNSGQYISSPASVATQPFSPHHALSPAHHQSPRSHGTVDAPGTPVTSVPPGTPESQTDHPNSPFLAGQHVMEEELQLTPSHRSFSTDIINQSTPRQSSQSLLPHCSPGLPPNCSPLVKADLFAVMSQKKGPFTPTNGPFTPQARKRIFNPINSTQLFLSPQMYPLSRNHDTSLHDNSGVGQDLQNEGDKLLTQPVAEVFDGDITLTDENCENPVTVSVSDTDHVVLNTVLAGGVNNYPDSQQFYEKSHLLDNMYIAEKVHFDKSLCSTIVNSIGCISLPEPSETELVSHTDGEQPIIKKKRSTRSDKGKKRKKLSNKDQTDKSLEYTEAGVPVLKSLLTTSIQPGTGLEHQQTTTLMPRDFENQELVMLSPGGSSTLKFPVLECVDAPSSPKISSVKSVTVIPTEKGDGVSIMPENQVTSALMKSIAAGNSTEIIKQARTIAEVTTNDKKKQHAKKKRKSKDKTDKPPADANDGNSHGELNVNPGEVLTVTPVQLLKKVHVRTLDFENQFKKIQPKPVLPDISSSAVIIVNSLGPTDSTQTSVNHPTVINVKTSVNSHTEAISTKSLGIVTSSSSVKSITKHSNDISVTSISDKCNKTNSKQNTSNAAKIKEKEVSKSNESNPSTVKTSTETEQISKSDIGDTISTEKESGCINSEVIKGRRCTRSSKPASMEQLNDKGLPEKVKIDAENPPSTTAMGSKLYRRKPKSGKDMRVIMKHLRTMEDEDDIFSDFTENSMDSMASMKSPMSVASIMSPTSMNGNRSPASGPGFKSPGGSKSSFTVAGNMSPCTKTEKENHTKQTETKESSDMLDVKSRSNEKGIKVAESKRKGANSLPSQTKKNPKVSESKQQRNTGSEVKTVKLSSKNSSQVLQTVKVSSLGSGQTDSSEDDVPLSKLKEKIVEEIDPIVIKTDKKKDVANKSDPSVVDKGEKKKGKHSKVPIDKIPEAILKENEETIPVTPPGSPVSPRRTSPTDVLTPNKEVWMEKVGLTPTKSLTNSPHFTSPGRINPLDALAACQNSPLSERRRCYTPNTRNRFSSPFKSPSVARRRTPVKKLFDTTLPDQGSRVSNKTNTLAEVEEIIKNLQDKNPEYSLVRKVPSAVGKTSVNEKGSVDDDNSMIPNEVRDHSVAKNIKDKSATQKHGKKDGLAEQVDAGKKKKKSSKQNSKSMETKENSKSKETKENRKSKETKENSKSKETKENSKSKETKENSKSKETKENSKSKKTKEKSKSKESKEKSKSKETKKSSKSKEAKHLISDTVSEVQTKDNGKSNPSSKSSHIDIPRESTASDNGEHSDEHSDELERSVQETCAATDFLMKELENEPTTVEDIEIESMISNAEVKERSNKSNSLVDPLTYKKGESHKDKGESLDKKSIRSSETGNVKVVDANSSCNLNGNISSIPKSNNSNSQGTSDKTSHSGQLEENCNKVQNCVNYQGDHNSSSEKENNCKKSVRRTNLLDRNCQNASIATLTGLNSVTEREDLADYNKVNPTTQENQREVNGTPAVDTQTSISEVNSSSGHRHRHSSSKKRKKSRKRHHEESADGGDQERHKKKRRKHHKHKDHKHHRKHRKSVELSSLNVDAALSQLYTPSSLPLGSPPRISGGVPPPHVAHTVPQGTPPAVNSNLFKATSKDHPLQHSTPIVNNNCVKQAAFGTLFSPVNENVMTE